MPVDMNKDNFRDRVQQAADALKLKFQTTTHAIDMPDAHEVWKLLQCVEELIRQRPAPPIPSVALEDKHNVAIIEASRTQDDSGPDRAQVQEHPAGSTG